MSEVQRRSARRAGLVALVEGSRRRRAAAGRSRGPGCLRGTGGSSRVFWADRRALLVTDSAPALPPLVSYGLGRRQWRVSCHVSRSAVT